VGESSQVWVWGPGEDGAGLVGATALPIATFCDRALSRGAGPLRLKRGERGQKCQFRGGFESRARGWAGTSPRHVRCVTRRELSELQSSSSVLWAPSRQPASQA
jgi:hypothetical protein